MAARFFINGGTNNNWSSITNWSLTSGGTGGQAVPTNVDDVTLDNNSPNCICDTAVAKACKTFTCTSGYVNTLTLNVQLTVSGNVVLGANMTIASSALRLQMATTGSSITSNGCIIACAFAFQAISSTFTLIDDMYVTGNLTLAGATVSQVLNGNTIHVRGGFTLGSNSMTITGTTVVLLDGNVSVTASSNSFLGSFIINTAGTVTFAPGPGVIRMGNITYVAGTVITTNSLLQWQITGTTIDTSSIVWAGVTFTGNNTYTLNSVFRATSITLAASGVMAGSFGFNCTNLILSSLASTFTFAAGVTYTANNAISLATAASHPTIQSSVVNGTKAIFNITTSTSNDMRFTNMIDIDASVGSAINLLTGTFTRCLNVRNYINPITIAKISN